jgi:nonsense-mediated mRNA decay protein 3
MFFVISFKYDSQWFLNMTELLCPKCGRTSDKVRFIEAFCIDCYPVNIRIPKKLEIDQCKRCERMRIKGEWVNYNRKKIDEYVCGKCRGDFESARYDEGTITFIIKKDEDELEVERSVDVEIRTVMCRQCSRISGGYYQGLIQLRGDERKVERLADKLIKKLEKSTFITKAEEKENGLDLYVGSSKAVIGLVAEMKLKALITKKLVGLEEGKRLYRTTFLIRL